MQNEARILSSLEKMDGRLDNLERDMVGLKGDVSNLERSVVEIQVTQENIIVPQIKLLAEGHELIQEQIRGLSVIDALQGDVSMLKSALRLLSQDVEQLKLKSA
jgi:hypothetical protein